MMKLIHKVIDSRKNFLRRMIPGFYGVAATGPGIDLTIQDVVGIITGLACWFTRVALVLIVVFVIFYGLKFMVAQGDPTKLVEAKKSFLWGLVGVMVILGTYTIIATVANGLGADYTLFLPLRC